MAVPALLIVLLVAPDKAAKAYPVAISLVAAAVFGGSLITPPSLIEQIARLQEPHLPEGGQAYCRKVTLVWTVWLLLNALIAGLLGWTGQEIRLGYLDRNCRLCGDGASVFGRDRHPAPVRKKSVVP